MELIHRKLNQGTERFFYINEIKKQKPKGITMSEKKLKKTELIHHKLNEGTERFFYIDDKGNVVSPYFELEEPALEWYKENHES